MPSCSTERFQDSAEGPISIIPMREQGSLTT